MPIGLNSEPWFFFVQNARREQLEVGSSPADYAKIAGFEDARLEKEKLTRQRVMEICQADADPWISFVTIMAWGAQNQVPGGKRKTISMFEQRDSILAAIEKTKLASSRQEAFHVWAQSGIRDLWVAYFTKVLFFFLYPKANCYIMDQWTAKAINLICAEKLIRRKHLNSRLAAPAAAKVYEQYCDLVDDVATHLSSECSVWSGMEAEAALFCKGGRKAGSNPTTLIGPWRSYVRENGGAWTP